MTFNIRFANPQDGPHRWEYRRELVRAVILAYQPDLLALQEVTYPQLEYLQEHLPAYEAFIAHRQVDRACQYPTIFYRPEGVEAGAGAEFWLSETPEVHCSKSWGSAFPRMVTYGQFRERSRPEWFYFGATHLDHVSEAARVEAARMLVALSRRLAGPLILAGDFNDRPGSPVHRLLIGGDSPLRDSWLEAGQSEEGVSTQHPFDGSFLGSRIDWILLTSPFKVREAAIIRDNFAGRYPSDHFPYCIEVEFEQKLEQKDEDCARGLTGGN